ncbi:anti-sigma factor [Rhizobium sp. BK251]|uniref:anti-sigma factor family protein n=1 Tax=Rhizobium sp. BK251 TaxID=2512125 RepID=UPI00104A3925|nr:anti-sigma factor [Rhizobium sp. BK251]TCL74724.1 anti-sigma factor RsiW [Rhizobium sp. BK251]
MQDLKKMPLEVQLSAFLNGETTPEQKNELEHLLATDAEAREVYEKLRHGTEFGRKRFDELLKEPVPLSMVRSIKSAQPPKKPVAPRFSRPSLKIAPTGPQALAAGLILFALGCGLGYFAGVGPAAHSPQQTAVAATSPGSWLDDIASYQRIYSRQQRHLVEVPATDSEEIVAWLTTNVGVRFNILDLTADGLVFQGARLLVANGKPVGQLVYRNEENDVISICFMRDAISPDTDEVREIIKDDIGLVSWHRAGASYVVAGPSSEASLDDLAEKVAAAI